MEILRLYYELTELLKSYRVFELVDKEFANTLLAQINKIRLSIVLLAEQYGIFWEQLNVEANPSGYTDSKSFSPDDISALIVRFIANLDATATLNLLHQGNRESVFTRQNVAWQQLASNVQGQTLAGQQTLFNLPQEILLGKNEALTIGVTNQQSSGQLFIHGANLKDDYSPNREALQAEIYANDANGKPNLPQVQLIPIEFKFLTNALDAKAVSLNGDKDIFSIKGDKSVLLTHVSTTSINARLSLKDNGRNQIMCSEVESLGVAGSVTNPYAVWYELPEFHLLRAKDRLSLKALNGSLITGEREAANVIHRLTFKGWTI